MARKGILVKTNRGKGIVPKNINWDFDTVLVYLVNDDYTDELDKHGKAVKFVIDKLSIEIVKLIE